MSFLAEVEALKKSPMPEVRSTIALKVSEYYNSGVFDGNEINIATDIIRLLARDAEVRVRKTLSECLKSNPQLPHDIAIGLANDDIEVAMPMLEFSSVLTEGDLIEIIRSTQQIAKLKVISRRDGLPEVVSSALAYTRNEEVVESLFHNKTAHISEESMQAVIKEFKYNGNIIGALIDRGDLPIGVAEKLINYASGKMRDKLIQDYKLSNETAESITKISQERATLSLLEDEPVREGTFVANVENINLRPNLNESANENVKVGKTEQLVRHLKSQGRLTQSLVLRSLCEGNLKFFEASMAVLAGTSILNARTLIMDKNPLALNALCKKANIPLSIIQAVQIIIEFTANEERSGQIRVPGFRQRLLEHVMSHNYDKNVPLMPYIIALIASKIETKDLV
jgi:uncharacterized protein (DUF2336 family)